MWIWCIPSPIVIVKITSTFEIASHCFYCSLHLPLEPLWLSVGSRRVIRDSRELVILALNVKDILNVQVLHLWKCRHCSMDLFVVYLHVLSFPFHQRFNSFIKFHFIIVWYFSFPGFASRFWNKVARLWISVLCKDVTEWNLYSK